MRSRAAHYADRTRAPIEDRVYGLRFEDGREEWCASYPIIRRRAEDLRAQGVVVRVAYENRHPTLEEVYPAWEIERLAFESPHCYRVQYLPTLYSAPPSSSPAVASTAASPAASSGSVAPESPPTILR